MPTNDQMVRRSLQVLCFMAVVGWCFLIFEGVKWLNGAAKLIFTH